MRNIHDDCTGYDFAAGVATGIRSFNVDPLGRLTGVSFPQVWKPGENVARCGGSERRCGRPACGCGLWAYHDGSLYPEGAVKGVIEGYGKTTVGTKGFRCEKARVVALCLPESPKAWKRWRATAWWAMLAALNGEAAIWRAVGSSRDVRMFVFDAVATVLAILCLVFAVRKALRARKLLQFNPDLAARIRRNYPDVKVYPSVKAMKTAHPLDPTLEPTPENDPTFWDTTTPTAPDYGSLSLAIPPSVPSGSMLYYSPGGWVPSPPTKQTGNTP